MWTLKHSDTVRWSIAAMAHKQFERIWISVDCNFIRSENSSLTDHQNPYKYSSSLLLFLLQHQRIKSILCVLKLQRRFRILFWFYFLLCWPPRLAIPFYMTFESIKGTYISILFRYMCSLYCWYWYWCSCFYHSL